MFNEIFNQNNSLDKTDCLGCELNCQEQSQLCLFQNYCKMEVPQISRTRLSSKKLSEGIRIDKKGHPILKGYKLHQVTFIDEIVKGKQINQIILVDCWKEHNSNRYENDNLKCCQIS